jgi:hypothetical protein
MRKGRWKCAECGQDVWAKTDLVARKREFRWVRRDARYCSAKCRQKAYRKRVTARASPVRSEPSQRDGSSHANEGQDVTRRIDAEVVS